MYRFKLIVTILVSMLLSGCLSHLPTHSNKEIHSEHDKNVSSYEKFASNFLNFKETFRPKDFFLISPADQTNVTTSFPQNKIDSRTADIINDSLENPARYEVYYKSNNSNLLVKVNFIYFPDSSQNQFVTINAISSMQNSNINDEFQTIARPLFEEYLLSFNGYLVLINFIDLKTDPSEKDYGKFISETILFYEQLEEVLLDLHK